MSSLAQMPRNTPGATAALKVLVVDDQDPVRNAVAALLNSRGFEAAEASNGFTALEMLTAEYYDVLLCDVRMPDMSGLDLMTKALEIDNKMPVLILTAVNDVHTAREALDRGAMDYLTKPIEMDDLEQAVRSAGHYRRTELKRNSGPQPVIPSPGETRHANLVGGPLDGRRVRVDDVRFRLWVVEQPDGEHVWASIEMPDDIPSDTRMMGSYAYSQADERMHWTAAI